MLILFLLFSSYLFYAHEPMPLKLASPDMSRSRLHLEHIVVDTENLKHKTKTRTETSTCDIREEDLSELTAQIYFQDENHPLKEFIGVQLQRRIAAAKLREDIRPSYDSLESLYEKKRRHSVDLKGLIARANSEEHTSDFIHNLVIASIEDAFIEKEKLIEKEKKESDALALKLHTTRRQMRIAVWGIVAGTVSSGLATTAILLGIFLGKSN